MNKLNTFPCSFLIISLNVAIFHIFRILVKNFMARAQVWFEINRWGLLHVLWKFICKNLISLNELARWRSIYVRRQGDISVTSYTPEIKGSRALGDCRTLTFSNFDRDRNPVCRRGSLNPLLQGFQSQTILSCLFFIPCQFPITRMETPFWTNSSKKVCWLI